MKENGIIRTGAKKAVDIFVVGHGEGNGFLADRFSQHYFGSTCLAGVT